MTFGGRILYACKQLKWSQNDLAKNIGAFAPIIGRYQREEIKTSVDVAAMLADVVGINLAYSLGKSGKMIPNKKSLQHLENTEQLPEKDKYNIFFTPDHLIKAVKLINIAA